MVLEVVLVVLVVVMTREEELVVLAELRSTAVLPASISAAGAAANPVVAFAAAADVVVVVDDVVLSELDVVVVTRVATLLVLSEAADSPPAARGIAVHRRPSMVVTKAPEGRPLDAMFRFLSSSPSSSSRSRWFLLSLINPKSAWPAARRNEETRGSGTKPKNTSIQKRGWGEAKMRATRAV